MYLGVEMGVEVAFLCGEEIGVIGVVVIGGG
jgi:hypothetical protein